MNTNGLYHYYFLGKMLKSRILQDSDRHMKIYIGDLILDGRVNNLSIAQNIFYSRDFSLRHPLIFEDGRATF